MRNAFYCILLMSAVGSVAFALVKLMALVFNKQLSAGWRYTALKCSALFFAVPLALIGLFLPTKTVGEVQGFSFMYSYSSTATATAVRIMPSVSAHVAKGEALRLMQYIWLSGFCIVLLWYVFCFIKFRHSIASSSPATAKLYDTARQCQSEAGIRRGVSLLINNKISTPMLVGLVTPKILLQNSDIEDEHAKYILCHELIHFKSGDLWVKMGLVFLKALHWFNPFVFLLAKELDLWCEYSCDEKLVRCLSREQCKQYGMAILCSIVPVSKMNTSFTTSFVSDKTQIERRLCFMLNSKKAEPIGKAIAVVLAVLMLTIGTVTAFAGSQMVAAPPAPAIPDAPTTLTPPRALTTLVAKLDKPIEPIQDLQGYEVGAPNSRGFSFCEPIGEQADIDYSKSEAYEVRYTVPGGAQNKYIGIILDILPIKDTDFNDPLSVDILVNKCVYLDTGSKDEALPSDYDYTITFPEGSEFKNMKRSIRGLRLEDIRGVIPADINK